MKRLMWRPYVFLLCVICVLQTQTDGFAQPPSPGGGPTIIPGGGAGGSIGVSILQTPSNPVLLGKTITGDVPLIVETGMVSGTELVVKG